MQNYRHELKYKITYSDYLALRSRLRTVMKPDPNVGDAGQYLISSVYFDDLDDTALAEKLTGVQKREKFRLRYYNNNFSEVKLEKKQKNGSLCLKTSAWLTEHEYRDIITGNIAFMPKHPSPLVNELYFKIKSKNLRPKVNVSYIREPYVYAPGNVRVTFDMDIKTSAFNRDFLSGNNAAISAQDNFGDIILEVKYDEFLPEIVAMLLQTDGVRQQAFSKYAACRRYG